MLDAAGTTTYSYTAGNQLWTEVQPFTSSTVTNTYVNRLRASLVLQQPSGLWTNKFVYDAAGRLTNVTSPAGVFAYTPGGASSGSLLIKKLALPNTSYITNTYDSVARLTGTYLDNSANSVLDSSIYGYNSANERTAFTNAAGVYVLYGYDNIGQIKVANSSTSTENRGYAYDSAWNVNYTTNNVGGVSTYVLDAKNELTSAGGIPYVYDSNGNRITNNSFLSYTYDCENRLTLISDVVYHSYESGFTYDGLGRLRTRIEYTWNGSKWITGSTVNYIYDRTRVIQERDGSNNPLVSYTRGTDLSGSLEGAGGIGGLLARSSGYSSGNWTTNHFYHADGNGNIMYLEDSSQVTAATYRYDPFGNTLSSSGSMAGYNVYRFSSREQHANSGMYIYLHRFYDPSVQRWLNADPVSELGDFNLFRFVRNSSTDYLDPQGLDPACTADIGIFSGLNAKQERDASDKGAPIAGAIGFSIFGGFLAEALAAFAEATAAYDEALATRQALDAELSGTLQLDNYVHVTDQFYDSVMEAEAALRSANATLLQARVAIGIAGAGATATGLGTIGVFQNK